ncbi:MAG: phycobilisome linker polypeptide [Cyanobacteria bacterium P01_H01_bin.58]
MLGQYRTGNISSSSSRIFVYEVAGLRQNDMTTGQKSPIRSSQNKFIQVPLCRMNEATQSITRMGGKIVDIKPL